MRTLSTARLELRPWEESFESDLFRLSSNERVMRFVGDGRPWSRERTAERHRAGLAARYRPANEASGRVMVKIGMRLYGDIVDTSGEPVLVRELSRADWEALRA
jgi:RimJ/RimL family protein N-acetyltransferase